MDIPFHARWRHFVAGAPELPTGDPPERARAAFHLIILSVLLDAGAGPGWCYADPIGGQSFSRSEGLAVASQRMVEAGALDELAQLDTGALAHGFQVSAENPLLGLDGRAALLRRLGKRIEARPDLFQGERLGGLYDTLASRAEGNVLPAPAILALLLEALGPIGPIDWRSTAFRSATAGVIPLSSETTRATACCRCTSCRNGWLIR